MHLPSTIWCQYFSGKEAMRALSFLSFALRLLSRASSTQAITWCAIDKRTLFCSPSVISTNVRDGGLIDCSEPSAISCGPVFQCGYLNRDSSNKHGDIMTGKIFIDRKSTR